MTYWILDTRFVREVAELRRVVLGLKHPVPGVNEVLRSTTEEHTGRYLVFDLESHAVDILGLEQGPRNGWQGPYHSREEAETVAKRLNTASD